MRILYLTDGLAANPPSPAAGMAWMLARMAQRDGHRVALMSIADEPGEATRLDGIRVLPIASRTIAEPRYEAELDREVRAGEFEVAHVVTARPAAVAMRTMRRLDLPTVVSLTGLPEAQPAATSELLDALTSQTFCCVAPSAFAAAAWERWLPGARFRVLPHGIDLIGLAAARHEARRTQPAERVLTVDCLLEGGERCGAAELLTALAAHPELPVRIRLCGPLDPETEYGRSVAALVSRDPRVSRLAARPDGDSGAAARTGVLACLPTLEPLPFARAVHECAALGTPCLVNDLGAQAEAIERFGCGERLPAGDWAAWVRALGRHALAADVPALAARGRMPHRLEEEAFLYQSLYRDLMFRCRT